MLQAKKKGAFIVLQAHRAATNTGTDAVAGTGTGTGDVEYRELCGVAFSQRRNGVLFGEEHLKNVVVAGSGLQEGTALSGEWI